MPKKRGSRGGPPRGNSFTNSNGTTTTSRGGRFFHLKKRGGGRGGSNNRRGGRGPKQAFPELDSFAEEAGGMKGMARRTGENLRQHRGDIFSRNLRGNPVVFVKAKELYDPSAELYKKLEEKAEDDSNETPEITNTTESTQNPLVDFNDVDEMIALVNLDDSDDEEASIEKNDISGNESKEQVETETNVKVQMETETDTEVQMEFDKVAMETDKLTIDTDKVVKTSEETDTEIKVPIETDKDAQIIEITDAINNAEEEEMIKSADESSNDEDLFVIDNDGDRDLDIVGPKPNVSNILSASTNTETPRHEEALEHEPVLTIGKVQLKTHSNNNGDMYTLLPSYGKNRGMSIPFDDDDFDYNGGYDSELSGGSDEIRDYIENVMQLMKNDSDFDDDEYESDTNFDIMAPNSDEDTPAQFDGPVSEEEQEEPEYGFLEEDFEFDTSQIEITNVRFGIENQYYVRSFELNGSADDFIWVSESDVFDFVLLKGVREHRLNSFMKFITNGLLDNTPEDDDDDFDVHISDSAEEEEEQDESGSDDGLGDLVAFSKKQHEMPGYGDYVPSKSIRSKGRGRKKELDLDDMYLDTDLVLSLQEQYQAMRAKKKDKKQAARDAKIWAGTQKHDLRLLYPFHMTYRDMKNELDDFLHDGTRDVMSFPPLVPEGNKVAIKMSKLYNMKIQKCGGGLKHYIQAVKCRSTVRNVPRYNDIGYIAKKKSHFLRSDVKKLEGEIMDLNGGRKKSGLKTHERVRPKHKHRDGDIVGAHAPEISQSNFGRQMLEKMGWVQGEGLGTHGNKGISVPIMAVVKTTKTGLQ